MSEELHPFDQIRVLRIGREAEVYLAAAELGRKGASLSEDWRIVGVSFVAAARAFDGLTGAPRREIG